ncbi:hypothetical protein AAMO2058_000947400 [Amorphochlora amoebiformis]
MTRLAIWPILMLVVAPVSLAADGCGGLDISVMEPWEQRLMHQSEGTSELGRVCFVTADTDQVGRAYFILGLKTLHNFWYDLCKFAFDKAIRLRPDFQMAYWGRAMCESQLIWNSESPKNSNHYLSQGRSRNPKTKLSPREEEYYHAAEVLNNVTMCNSVGTLTPEGTRACRIRAFGDRMRLLADSYPTDTTAQAFGVLGYLAVGSVECKGPQCKVFDQARAAARKAYEADPTFSGTLHYGMHAHDFPVYSVYSEGTVYAIKYPEYVNGTCHSLHMPSHIWDRQGNFSLGILSNTKSIRSADLFSQSGALAFNGGPIGKNSTDHGGKGFAFNAGNIYHSLEYLQYEKLMRCEFAPARQLVARMAFAKSQAVSRLPPLQGHMVNHSKPMSEFAPTLGSALVQATTYTQWLYRMQARQVLVSMLLYLMPFGEGGPMAAQAAGLDHLSSPLLSLPQPLSWAPEATVYSHQVYSPQSEAGLWQALALSRLIIARKSLKLTIPLAPPPLFRDSVCGGGDTYEGCAGEMGAWAREVVGEASEVYKRIGMKHEQLQMDNLQLQIDSVRYYAAGDLESAVQKAQMSSQTTEEAMHNLVPTSTSLMFIPGTAFYGIMSLMAAAETMDSNKRNSYLKSSIEGFSSCLQPLGRPNHLLCLLGKARAAKALGDKSTASSSYSAFMASVAEDGECAPSVAEARKYLNSKGGGGDDGDSKIKTLAALYVSIPIAVVIVVSCGVCFHFGYKKYRSKRELDNAFLSLDMEDS